MTQGVSDVHGGSHSGTHRGSQGVSPGGSQGAVDLSGLVAAASPASSAAGVPAGVPTGAASPGAQAAVAVPSLVMPASDATFAPLVELSRQVPLIVLFWSQHSPDHETLIADLASIANEMAGKVIVITVEAEPNPQLVEAFSVESVPAVLAVMAGAPLPLFVGAYPRAEMRTVFDKVLEFAAQNNVTGSATVNQAASADGAANGGDAVPAEREMPPLHKEAYEAAEKGDYETAIASWRKALAQSPNDAEAIAGLAQVSLLNRLQGKSLSEIRQSAADNPQDVSAQLDVADLDVSGGHFEDGFDRLLTCFVTASDDDKTRIRERLIELFDVVGAHDPSVKDARARLTNLLY